MLSTNNVIVLANNHIVGAEHVVDGNTNKKTLLYCFQFVSFMDVTLDRPAYCFSPLLYLWFVLFVAHVKANSSL